MTGTTEEMWEVWRQAWACFCRPAGALSEPGPGHAMVSYYLSVVVFDNEHLIPAPKKCIIT